jgi:hypothetical protein
VAIEQEQAVGNRSGLGYVIAVMNCALWFMYGVWPKQSSTTMAINLFGVASQVYCLAKFLYYCEDQNRQWWFTYVVTGLESTLMVILFYVSDVKRNLTFFKWVIAVSRTLPSLLPLSNLVSYEIENVPQCPALFRVYLYELTIYDGMCCRGMLSRIETWIQCHRL